MSCPQIWTIEQEKDREKEKVGGRPAKLNEERIDRDLEREIKSKGDFCFTSLCFLSNPKLSLYQKCSPPKVVEQDLRPISLTPHIAKVMEGLTLDSLFKQVCDKLDTHQFALAGKSTTHALVFFLQVILEALDQGDTYARIFFTDFSKGFDLVDHNILIQEMELLGVHEATIRWIGSFLTDRSQRVRIGQVYSHPVTPNGGIPQGTKLAPLLFAILVNNLCRDWRYRIKYVDDTSVFESIPRCFGRKEDGKHCVTSVTKTIYLKPPPPFKVAPSLILEHLAVTNFSS